MKCYLSCFGNSKYSKHQKLKKNIATCDDQRVEGDVEKHASAVTETNKRKLQEFLNSRSTKSVTFDLDVEACQELSASDLVKENVDGDLSSLEVDQDLVQSNVDKGLASAKVVVDPIENNVEKELSSLQVAQNVVESSVDNESASAETVAQGAVESNVNNKSASAEVVAQVSVQSNVEQESASAKVDSNVEKEGENKESESFPHNHRYQNCSNDDEYNDTGFEETDMDYNDDGQTKVQGESSESLFSLSVDSRKQVSAAEKGEKEVTSPMPKLASSDQEHGMNGKARDRSEYVQSVLNPVENLTQWKAVREITTSSSFRHEEKENITVEHDSSVLISPKPRNMQKSKLEDEEFVFNTSLSSWLVTPLSKSSADSIKNSPKSHEDRPILGALTIGDLQFSASISPKRSRSKSPEDMPIIGTVGSYWRHTGQAVDSDSDSSCTSVSKSEREKRERYRVKWKSSPFQERLERAVEKAVDAQV